MADKPTLTICVATLIHFDKLEQCLQTMNHYASYNYKIVIVDGCDSEHDQGKVEDIASRTGASFIHLGENRRAMGAFNAALAECDTKYIAFLHDDAAFIPNSDHFWPRLLDIMQYESVGMCGPALSNCWGVQHFLRWDLPDRAAIDYIHGACMVFRTETIREQGGMTEDIFPCDDIELAVRMRVLGYDIVVDRRCFLYHERHMTYKYTRSLEEGRSRMPVMFNKIIEKYGVRNTIQPFFVTPEWDWILATERTWEGMMRRLDFSFPEWTPRELRNGHSTGERSEHGDGGSRQELVAHTSDCPQ